MEEQKQDDQLEPTYNSSVPIQDVVLKIYRKRWRIERNRNIYADGATWWVYIYIYIYISAVMKGEWIRYMYYNSQRILKASIHFFPYVYVCECLCVCVPCELISIFFLIPASKTDSHTQHTYTYPQKQTHSHTYQHAGTTCLKTNDQTAQLVNKECKQLVVHKMTHAYNSVW